MTGYEAAEGSAKEVAFALGFSPFRSGGRAIDSSTSPGLYAMCNRQWGNVTETVTSTPYLEREYRTKNQEQRNMQYATA